MPVGNVIPKDFFKRTSMVLAKRDIVPSMLDPAFEEEDCASQGPDDVKHRSVMPNS